MTREQLDALLRAGLITAEQHTAALGTADSRGRITEQPQLTLELAADDVEFSPEDRTVTGIITVYEQYIPSHHMILHTGCMEPRQPLNRVKLLRDHNHSDPLGYMTELDAETMIATFHVPEGDNGDRALLEASNGLRDGMSVGWTTLEYDIDDDWMLHIRRAELYETSLCALPAIPDAGVISVAAALATARKEHRTMNRAQLAAALAAGTITQEQHDQALATIETLETSPTNPRPAQPVAPEVEDGPQLQTDQPRGRVEVNERLSLRDVNRRLVEAADTGDLARFQLALADIVPADDAAPAFLRDDWEGEAWRENEAPRPWIDAFGAPAELNSLNGKGWEWGEEDENGDGGEPHVEEYAGNKTEIASNEIGTAPKDYLGWRCAAGWDVDRVFEDFASEAFWGSFWPAVIRSYKRKSNTGTRTRLLAKAIAPGATLGGTETVATGGVKALLKQLVKDVRGYGKVNRIFLGDTMFEELEDLDTENLPLWLKSAVIGLDVAEGSAEIGTLRILNDPALAASQGVAFDSRAAKVRERAPFRLQALNISRAGIDVGIYSYLRLDDYENRAIVKRTYGEELPTE